MNLKLLKFRLFYYVDKLFLNVGFRLGKGVWFQYSQHIGNVYHWTTVSTLHKQIQNSTTQIEYMKAMSKVFIRFLLKFDANIWVFFFLKRIFSINLFFLYLGFYGFCVHDTWSSAANYSTKVNI